jgi:hypothetical protein
MPFFRVRVWGNRTVRRFSVVFSVLDHLGPKAGLDGRSNAFSVNDSVPFSLVPCVGGVLGGIKRLNKILTNRPLLDA